MKESEDGRWIIVEDGLDHWVLKENDLDDPGSYPHGVHWCLHCERVYPVGSFRYDKEDELVYCPYQDCSGDYFFDSYGWDWPKEKHPEYPEKPIPGVCYPLY